MTNTRNQVDRIEKWKAEFIDMDDVQSVLYDQMTVLYDQMTVFLTTLEYSRTPTWSSRRDERTCCRTSSALPVAHARLRPDVKRFRGGLAFEAHRLVYHSTLGLREIKKKKISLRPARPHPTLHKKIEDKGAKARLKCK